MIHFLEPGIQGVISLEHGLDDRFEGQAQVMEKEQKQLADQAEIMGYRAMEHQLTPDSEYELQAPTAMYWHPGVNAALAGDTILVMPGGCEIVTRSSVWPQLRVQVKGHDVACCGLLLIREPQGQNMTDIDNPKKAADLFTGLNLPDDDSDGSRMDSIWELDLSAQQSVFEECESEYSRQSVLD